MRCDRCQFVSPSEAKFCSNCGNSFAPTAFVYPQGFSNRLPVPLTPGEMIGNGRWVAQAVIGQGGMGRVYRALDRETNEMVAIKELLEPSPPSPEAHKDFQDRFKAESQLLYALRQLRCVPNLIRSFSPEGSRFYYVMEYIEGTDLISLIRKNNQPLDLIEVITYADEVCEILGWLHNRTVPIVHRDIKPHNLRRRKNGSIVLLDFGVAREITPGDLQTTQVGSFGYAAPEQFMNGRAEPRSDLYSLAATMFFLLSAHDPGPPQPRPAGSLRTFNPLVPPELEQIILTNLHPDPYERHNTVQEFKHDLQQGHLTEQLICPNPACRQLNERRRVHCANCTTLLLDLWRPCNNCHQRIPFRARFCPYCRTKQ